MSIPCLVQRTARQGANLSVDVVNSLTVPTSIPYVSKHNSYRYSTCRCIQYLMAQKISGQSGYRTSQALLQLGYIIFHVPHTKRGQLLLQTTYIIPRSSHLCNPTKTHARQWPTRKTNYCRRSTTSPPTRRQPTMPALHP